MNNLPDQNKINLLCKTIEEALGHPLNTPKDFNTLSEIIFEKMHEMVSPSTLMRLWGYIDSDVKPRILTLSILARFAGFRDWQDFCTAEIEKRQSGLVLNRSINVENLSRGQRIHLRWAPNRVCDVIYLGNFQFEVEASENTGLKKGATFKCMLFIEGEPLFLDNVKQPDIPASAYVCGKLNGIAFELI